MYPTQMKLAFAHQGLQLRGINEVPTIMTEMLTFLKVVDITSRC